MAVFRPDPAHLATQIKSIAEQTDIGPLTLIAVIADGTSETLLRDTAAGAGVDVHVLNPGGQLDAVRAFEAGLTEALTISEKQAADGPEPLIAMSDQDDLWHPQRLSRGCAEIRRTGALLVHSDARLIDDSGTELHPSMFRYERRHRAPGLRGLLYRNNITGMTTLMQVGLLRTALPFPQQNGVHFYHDLWLGLIAEALPGPGVHLIQEALVDYRQHEKNAIGAVDRSARRWLRRRSREERLSWMRREAGPYALARYLGISVHNRMAETMANGGIPVDSARTGSLRPYLRHRLGAGPHLLDAARLLFTGHARLSRIAAGFALVNAGRLVWTLRDTFYSRLPKALDDFDNRLYGLSPGVPPKKSDITGAIGGGTKQPQDYKSLIDTRKMPSWEPVVTPETDAAIIILVPTLNPTEIFAGIATALDIGLGLAARGRRVRFIATDMPLVNPAASRLFVTRRLAPEAIESGAANRIELQCGVLGRGLTLNPDDRILATAWWSAHIARHLIDEYDLNETRFWYLIQDFEPNFYPWGPEFADAMASYELGFEPIFNTTLLRDHFATQGFGFATAGALAFHPSIDIARYADAPRNPVPSESGARRLALYGRPEVPRNMFATAIEALGLFIQDCGLGPDDIAPVSIGLRHDPVKLPGGVVLESMGKLAWDDYPPYLLGTDLGLTLMYSPHPSHPPIEMAASGVRVVTNRFGGKDLATLSPAILSSAPTGPALAEALLRAWNMPPVCDADRRIDLTLLGDPLDKMLDRLHEQLGATPGVASYGKKMS
ncbi:glycosyl transferase family 1 [Roseovarius sp. A21]|uniref:Glycosyl transferase family 1 n=2 Tax=Roseovarius bejariae TaxID=2576383 RepID=A0A844CZT4_9RHOB|nr:glycosyl transferase family 1 [Roseovarius bejariae]